MSGSGHRTGRRDLLISHRASGSRTRFCSRSFLPDPPPRRGLWEMCLCTPGWVGQGFQDLATDPKPTDQVSRVRGHAPPQVEQIVALFAFLYRRFPFICARDAHRGLAFGECHRRGMSRTEGRGEFSRDSSLDCSRFCTMTRPSGSGGDPKRVTFSAPGGLPEVLEAAGVVFGLQHGLLALLYANEFLPKSLSRPLDSPSVLFSHHFDLRVFSEPDV